MIKQIEGSETLIFWNDTHKLTLNFELLSVEEPIKIPTNITLKQQSWQQLQ